MIFLFGLFRFWYNDLTTNEFLCGRMKIEVECYSGYKANERPISFTLDDRKLIVEKIIDHWKGPDFEYFKLLADDGKVYLLKHDEMGDKWEVERVYEYRNCGWG